MSNQIYEEGYYNAEQKLRFLSQFGDATQNAYRRVLSRAKSLEEPLGKDLYNFNQIEIEQLIKYMAPKTTESVQHSLSVVQYYIRWAIDENLRDNNINPLDSVTGRDYFKRLVDTSAQTLFTYEEVFNEVVYKLINYQDQVVVAAIFEGINGKKFSELLNLKRTDIDEEKNVVKLVDEDGSERVLEISDGLTKILIKAYEEKVYYKKNGIVSDKIRNKDTLDLIDSSFVIKHSNTNVKSDKAEAHTISRRLKMIADFFDMPYFNASNIRNSGMLYEGWKKYRENNGKGLTQQDYYDICKQFDTANKDRYAYTYLKRSFLNEENIKELYGDKKDA